MSLSTPVETTCSKSADETATPESVLTFSITLCPYEVLSIPFCPVITERTLASISSSWWVSFQLELPLSEKTLLDSLIFMISSDFSDKSFWSSETTLESSSFFSNSLCSTSFTNLSAPDKPASIIVFCSSSFAS